MRFIWFHKGLLSDFKKGLKQSIQQRLLFISAFFLVNLIDPRSKALVRSVYIHKILFIAAQERTKTKSTRVEMSLDTFLSRLLKFCNIIFLCSLLQDLKELAVNINSMLSHLYTNRSASSLATFKEFSSLINNSALICQLHFLGLLLHLVLFDLKVGIKENY